LPADLLNPSRIASELDVTLRTVRAWRRRPGFPKAGTLAEVRRWVRDMRHRARERQREALTGPRTEVQARIEEADAQIAEARAALAGLKLRRLLASTIAVDEHKAILAARAFQLRYYLEPIGAAVTPAVLAQHGDVYGIQDVIDRAIAGALQRFVDAGLAGTLPLPEDA
jgi:hypothetical protein